MSPEKAEKEPGWGELAVQLKVARRVLFTWRRLPGAPETADLGIWKNFVEENSLGIAPNRVAPRRAELMEENLVKRNRLLDLEIAKQERSVIERAAVDALLLRVASMQKTILYQSLEREMPAKAAGRSAEEIAVLGRETADNLCEIFSREIEQWKQS